MPYVKPALEQQYFTCPHCQTLSEIKWGKFQFLKDIGIIHQEKSGDQTK